MYHDSLIKTKGTNDKNAIFKLVMYLDVTILDIWLQREPSKPLCLRPANASPAPPLTPRRRLLTPRLRLCRHQPESPRVAPCAGDSGGALTSCSSADALPVLSVTAGGRCRAKPCGRQWRRRLPPLCVLAGRRVPRRTEVWPSIYIASPRWPIPAGAVWCSWEAATSHPRRRRGLGGARSWPVAFLV